MRPPAPALALALALVSAGCLDGGLVGKPAPAFSITLSSGERINETSFLGRWVVLDLMATWCGPCKLEVAHLREVQRVFGERVVIVSIGVDPRESDAELDAFALREGAPWPHGLDRDGKMWQAYSGRIIPKLVILDPEGRVAFERQGEVLPAAIARVIDPGAALPESRSPANAYATAVLAALLGFLAVANPYRRLHRDGARDGPSWLALGLLGVLGVLAWRFSGIVSTRATLGSLALGIASAGALVWWRRARSKPAGPQGGHAAMQALDRAYEASPHFAVALVLSLTTTGLVGFAAPIVGFLGGYAGGIRARAKLPPDAGVKAGLAGLALAAAGLLVFGVRYLVAAGLL